MCHALQVCFSLLDLVIVLRWNVTILGIPDQYFALVADDVMHPLISRTMDIPFTIFAATMLCPPGLEASVFAILHSFGHVGKDVGKWVGATLLHLLGASKQDLSMLWLCILIRSVLKILPIVLVFLFIPNITPDKATLPEEIRLVVQNPSSEAGGVRARS